MDVNRRKIKELFRYGIIGILTTIINILFYIVCARFLKINYIISTIIAWLMAVIFAFFSNKYIVFKNKEKKYIWKEFNYFMITRYATGGLDLFIMFFGIDLLKQNDFIIKIISNIIVIILNYFLAKYFVFK